METVTEPERRLASQLQSGTSEMGVVPDRLAQTAWEKSRQLATSPAFDSSELAGSGSEISSMVAGRARLGGGIFALVALTLVGFVAQQTISNNGTSC